MYIFEEERDELLYFNRLFDVLYLIVFLIFASRCISTVCDCRISCHTPILNEIYQMHLIYSNYHLKLAESIE